MDRLSSKFFHQNRFKNKIYTCRANKFHWKRKFDEKFGKMYQNDWRRECYRHLGINYRNCEKIRNSISFQFFDLIVQKSKFFGNLKLLDERGLLKLNFIGNKIRLYIYRKCDSKFIIENQWKKGLIKWNCKKNSN